MKSYLLVPLILIAPFFLLFLFWQLSTMGTTTISKKCAVETNKPPEIRDIAKIEEESKNFDSCLKSITFWEKLYYGLLP